MRRHAPGNCVFMLINVTLVSNIAICLYMIIYTGHSVPCGEELSGIS